MADNRPQGDDFYDTDPPEAKSPVDPLTQARYYSGDRTSNLVTRLRAPRDVPDHTAANGWRRKGPSELELCAADEIERLTRELKVQKAVNELAYIPHRNLVESRDGLQKRFDALQASCSQAAKDAVQFQDERDRLRAALIEGLAAYDKDDFPPRGWIGKVRSLVANGSPDETTAPQAPTARIYVTDDGPAGVVLYAPGLPIGEHDVYCVPEAVAPMMRPEKASGDSCGRLVDMLEKPPREAKIGMANCDHDWISEHGAYKCRKCGAIG